MISIGLVNLDDSVGRGTHWVFFFFFFQTILFTRRLLTLHTVLLTLTLYLLLTLLILILILILTLIMHTLHYDTCITILLTLI